MKENRRKFSGTGNVLFMELYTGKVCLICENVSQWHVNVYTYRLYIVRINFVWQLGWIMGCPDIWLNIICGCVRVFLREISIGIRGLIKQFILSKWESIIQSKLRFWVNKEAEEGTILLFLPNCLRCNIGLLPLALLVVRLLYPDWNPHCELSQLSGQRMWSELHRRCSC